MLSFNIRLAPLFMSTIFLGLWMLTTFIIFTTFLSSFKLLPFDIGFWVFIVLPFNIRLSFGLSSPFTLLLFDIRVWVFIVLPFNIRLSSPLPLDLGSILGL